MRIRAQDIVKLLRERYPLPEWCLVTEVANGTGFNASRWADAVAVNMYPSRGLEINGFEIKVDRRDWVKELKTPDKAEAVAQYCDHWWLVVSDPSIVHEGELPAAWGLLAPNKNGKLAIVTKPTALEPKAITRSFMASLLRKAFKESPSDKALRVAESEGFKQGLQKAQRTVKDDEYYKKLYEDLRDKETAFRQATGIDIRWEPPSTLKRRWKLAQSLEFEERTIERLHKTAQQVADTLKGYIGEYERDITATIG